MEQDPESRTWFELHDKHWFDDGPEHVAQLKLQADFFVWLFIVSFRFAYSMERIEEILHAQLVPFGYCPIAQWETHVWFWDCFC